MRLFLVTRTMAYFFNHKRQKNAFILEIATLLSQETQQPLHHILYSHALSWPIDNGNWVDPYSGRSQLPDEHHQFAVSHKGEICLLNEMVETACRLYLEGHRHSQKLWQSNDVRTVNQVLPTQFLLAIGEQFPSFGKFYTAINEASQETPLAMMQMLREGLRKGSAAHNGQEFDAGSEANEAIMAFDIWFEKTKAMPSDEPEKNLHTRLVNLPYNGETFEYLLDTIFLKQGVNVRAGMSDTSTCVQINGNALENLIQANLRVLRKFEKEQLSQAGLLDHQAAIKKELEQYHMLSNKRKPSFITNILSESTTQLAYFTEAFMTIWAAFGQDWVSPNLFMALHHLLKQLTPTQQDELFHQKTLWDVAAEKSFPLLQDYLYQLEKKSRKNCLQAENEREPFTTVDAALLEIIAYNHDLLSFVTNNYPFIVFTQQRIAQKALSFGVIIQNEFHMRDEFNFRYYLDQTIKHSDNYHLYQAAIMNLQGFIEATSEPILHDAIKEGNYERVKALLDDNPKCLTHVDQKTGLSALMFASSSGNAQLCQLIWTYPVSLELTHQGKTAEALWPDTLRGDNPFTALKNQLVQLAKKPEECSGVQYQVLLDLIFEQNTYFLYWDIQEDRTLMSLTKSEALWQACIDRFNKTGFSKSINFRTPQHSSLLLLAASQGLLQICQQLLGLGLEVNLQNLSGDTALSWAAHIGDFEICKLLLEHHAHPNFQGQCKYTALHFAVSYSFTTICELLLQHGADPNIYNQDSDTALHIAAKKNNLEACELLIQYGANIDDIDINGKTALIIACEHNHLGISKFLLGKGANFNTPTKDQGSTALHFAAVKGHEEIGTLLLECGVDPNIRNQVGGTALMAAAQFNHVGMCKLLIDSGADMLLQSTDKMSVLHFAAFCNAQEACEFFLNAGIPTDIQNIEGVTALLIACSKNNLYLCSLFLQHGAKANISNNDGLNALSFSSRNGKKELCTLLIENSPYFNLQGLNEAERQWPRSDTGNPFASIKKELMELATGSDVLSSERKQVLLHLVFKINPNLLHWQITADKRSFLDYAIFFYHPDVNEYLLSYSESLIDENARHQWFVLVAKHGHDPLLEKLLGTGTYSVDKKDVNGEMALTYAALNNHRRVCQLLITNYANPNLSNDDQDTALHIASREGHAEMCHYLLTHQANPNAKNGFGSTALYLAVVKNDYAISRLLLEYGADLNIKDIHENTPLTHAAQMQNPSMCSLMLNADTHIDLNHLVLAESYWRNLANPFLAFKQKLIQLATDDDVLTIESKDALLQTLFRHNASLLTWELNQDGHFWTHALRANKPRIMSQLVTYIQTADNHVSRDELLLMAVKLGNAALCDYLLSTNNCSIDDQDDLDETMLMLAAKQGHWDICTLLLKHGADFELRNVAGCTADELWRGNASQTNPFTKYCWKKYLERAKNALLNIVQELKSQHQNAVDQEWLSIVAEGIHSFHPTEDMRERLGDALMMAIKSWIELYPKGSFAYTLFGLKRSKNNTLIDELQFRANAFFLGGMDWKKESDNFGNYVYSNASANSMIKELIVSQDGRQNFRVKTSSKEAYERLKQSLVNRGFPKRFMDSYSLDMHVPCDIENFSALSRCLFDMALCEDSSLNAMKHEIYAALNIASHEAETPLPIWMKKKTDGSGMSLDYYNTGRESLISELFIRYNENKESRFYVYASSETAYAILKKAVINAGFPEDFTDCSMKSVHLECFDNPAALGCFFKAICDAEPSVHLIRNEICTHLNLNVDAATVLPTWIKQGNFRREDYGTPLQRRCYYFQTGSQSLIGKIFIGEYKNGDVLIRIHCTSVSAYERLKQVVEHAGIKVRLDSYFKSIRVSKDDAEFSRFLALMSGEEAALHLIEDEILTHLGASLNTTAPFMRL